MSAVPYTSGFLFHFAVFLYLVIRNKSVPDVHGFVMLLPCLSWLNLQCQQIIPSPAFIKGREVGNLAKLAKLAKVAKLAKLPKLPKLQKLAKLAKLIVPCPTFINCIVTNQKQGGWSFANQRLAKLVKLAKLSTPRFGLGWAFDNRVNGKWKAH